MTTQTTTLSIHGVGTATDSTTGLMWMIPFAGQEWNGDSPVGTAVDLSWPQASTRFGRGRRLKSPPQKEATPYWSVGDSDRPPLSRESYTDYEAGSKQLFFAGFRDWRLPIVEECFTLMEIEDSEDIFPSAGTGVWTANSSNLSGYSKSPRYLREWLNFSPECAWWWQGNDLFADTVVSQPYMIRLVRSGTIFSILH